MKKRSVKISLVCLLLLLTLSIAITNKNQVNASPQPTISVRNPQTGTGNFIFYRDTTTVGSRFNVTLEINEGTDVAGWQVYMTYNSTIINATRAWQSAKDPQYIFYGKATALPAPFFDPQPPPPRLPSVQIGDTTVPLVGVNFTTPKKLATIEFKVLVEPPQGIGSNVSSTLLIDNTDTYIINPEIEKIPSSKTNGYYELRGWVRTATTISLNVNQTTVNIGRPVAISGSITPARPNVTVTISHRLGTTGAFTTLTTKQTTNTGNYSYTWPSNASGTHEFKASWNGDDYYSGAESTATPVTVNKLTSTITLVANPTSVKAGETVTLSGTITPTRSGVTVTISSGTTTIATDTTESDGTYSTTWKPTEAGTFELKASWAGDATYASDESDPVPVVVAGAPVDYLYYIIAAIVIIIVIAFILMYLRRKRPKTT